MGNSNFSFEMEYMFILYSVVIIITLFIPNSKACNGSPHHSPPHFRGDKIGQSSKLDTNAFEVCDMDRNGLTWKEVSSCIEQNGHFAQNSVFPTEEDFKKMDVNGDNVLSRRECRGSAFKLFCPPIAKHQIKPRGKLLGLSNDKKLSRSTVFAAVYPDSDNEGTENYIEGTENYNEGTETTPENWTNPEVWTTEVNNDSCHEKINRILKKVLKKLQMSQEVEMKAHEMVEEMLTEREIEEETTTEILGVTTTEKIRCEGHGYLR